MARKTTIRVEPHNEEKLQAGCDRLHCSQSAFINYLIYYHADSFGLHGVSGSGAIAPSVIEQLRYQGRNS